jgi:hypothetical protein
MASPDLERAAEFIDLNARLIDRRRFAYLFGDGDPGAVVEALRPYRNSDGGFGNALEPDLRAPLSTPQPVALAFAVLDEAGAFDDPMVVEACDWLATIATPDGGVPFVLEPALAHAHAPWWQADPGGRGSLFVTPVIAALLHKNGVEHPWLDGATETVWREIGELDVSSPYAARAVFTFLDHVPDRDRAEATMAEIGPRVLESAVTKDPEAPGEVHFPLDFAPEPGRLSRMPFDDDLIELHLDALAARQRDDGGWMFNWKVWAPLVELEWRGWLTVHSLRILRDNGRL